MQLPLATSGAHYLSFLMILLLLIWLLFFILNNELSFPKKNKKRRKEIPDPHLGQDPISDFSKFPCINVTGIVRPFCFKELQT